MQFTKPVMSMDSISFYVNGNLITVPNDVGADTALVTFLRDELGLKGTKYMCREGACGACVVNLARADPITGRQVSMAVNSCLTPILSCHGGSVTTVEGIGDKVNGYSKVQAALARCSGTQCGFCSPGMVMNMHSLIEAKKNVTMKDVENSFGGSFCRCTGYRPILDAFKSLSVDSTLELKQKIADIEDIWKICPNGEYPKCRESCNGQLYKREILNSSAKPCWYVPETLEQLSEFTKNHSQEEYVLLSGNTSQGVYRRSTHPSLYININYIPSLKVHSITKESLELGGNMSLTEIMELFYRLSQEKQFHFLRVLADHIQLVANVPVRNVGSLAGNLVIKHQHPEFPSDLFLMLETVNAKIVTAIGAREQDPITFTEFLRRKFGKSVITKVIIPILSDEYKLRTFKVMPRAQNVYALVNAGFLFKLDHSNRVIRKPNIVYGGISSKFVHATQTEEYFVGKNLFDVDVFQKGLSKLSEEIKPIQEGFQASPDFRKKLALNLFYKYVINLLPEKIRTAYRSGGPNLERPVSSGKQSFETIKKNWPITKPIIKTEGIIQCSGEAEYVNDIPESKGQLYGSLVLAERAGTFIKDIDPSPALAMDGIEAFFTAKDIPGENLVMKKNPNLYIYEDEELFCSGKVVYAGQPVGVVVARSEALAHEAASKVLITYRQGEQTVFTAREAVKQNISSRITHFTTKKPEKDQKNGATKHELSGEVELTPQYHFTMEPQSCVCVPIEDGINLYSASQWMSATQDAVAALLNIPENSINMEVRRLGGGFGSKITRAILVAGACALAAYKLNKPVKVILDIETNMKAIGKRNASYSNYEVGFNETGLIDWLKISVYEDMGHLPNDPCCMLVEEGLQNCYDISKWEINVYTVLTDGPSSSWMRAPGTLEGMTAIEEVMEHIAFTLGKDPLEVRLKNLTKSNSPLLSMIQSSVVESNYQERKQNIQLFNQENHWRKRGISFVPMSFHIGYYFTLNAMISIYAHDGTVSLTHGGVEMGQGINTKAIQACASSLGIDVNKVKVKPHSSMTSPNASFTGASITSDCVIYSTMKCCDILNERLSGVKERMPGGSWEEIIAAAHNENVNLNASFIDRLQDEQLKDYVVHATVITEVEVDILTGQYQILRSDILEDAGESFNPEIDIGQIEGAFVMGLGYFLSEAITLDPITGITTTNNTATYWVPGAKDIPIDFRVSLLKGTPNPFGVARSKSTGEPPLCLGMSAMYALRNAVISARQDTGLNDWIPFGQPFSVEKVCMEANTKLEHLIF